MPHPTIDNRTARRLFLQRHGLLSTQGGPGKGADLDGVIQDLGFVQVDSVNTLARAHDLILWSRRQSYRPPALQSLLAKDRRVFEHWTHDASVIPIGSFGHWRHRFDQDRAQLGKRWTDWHREEFLSKIDKVRNQISDDGACSSRDVGSDETRKSGGWWDWHPSKTALEYLWRTGELTVVRREGFRKIYDLTERVIPESYRALRPDIDETIDWACTTALERLGFATSRELSAFLELISAAQAKQWCADAVEDGRLIEVDIEGHDGQLRRCFTTPGSWEQPLADPSTRVRILSPFDPALRDRARAERLFGFHYRIEIFVPAPKRQYGYYVFPVMQGDRLIGRIDAKADRPASVLEVTAFWPEARVAMGKARVAGLETELDRLAHFAGCADVRLAPDWIRAAK